MSEFLLELARWTAGLGVGVGAAAWLMRSLFAQLLSKDLESFKADLERASIEHAARFSRLHERRAEAIDGLYRRLVQTQNAFMNLSGGILGDEGGYDERLEKAGAAGRDLLTFFGENRLYFDKPIVKGFGAIDRVLSDAWYTFVFERRDKSDFPIPEHEREDYIQVWRTARDGINKRIPELLDELESEMRLILGAPARRLFEGGIEGPRDALTGPKE